MTGDIDVNASSLLASAGGPRPAADVENMCECLLSANADFLRARGTDDDVPNHFELRNVAYYRGSLFKQAADLIREQRDEIARLTDGNADCPPCVSPGSCRANGKCLNAAAKIQQLTQRAERAEAERDAALTLLRQWLQFMNRTKKDAATVSEWDALRQASHEAVAQRKESKP